LVYDIVSAWALHTQEIEGVNNILKYAATLSPNITFKLLSSRITVKKLINRYKSFAERAALLEDCEYYFHYGTRSQCWRLLGYTFPNGSISTDERGETC
jgi:hypothetical protein